MTQDSRFWTGISTGDAGPYSYENMNELFRFMIGGSGTLSGVFFSSGSGGYDGLAVTQNAPAAANVLVQTGTALVHGSFYKSTAVETLAIAANSSGNPRIDSIVLTKLWATQTVRLEVLQGTPAVSPVAPTVTTTDGFKWQLKLADIAVANGFVTIVTANITDRAVGAIPRVVEKQYVVTTPTNSATYVDVAAGANLTINIQSTKIKFVMHAYANLAAVGTKYGFYTISDSEKGDYSAITGVGEVPTEDQYQVISVMGIFTGLTPGTHVLTPRHKVTGTTLQTLWTQIHAEELRD